MALIYGLTQAWKYGPILRSQGDASLYGGLNPTPAAAAVLVVLRSLLFLPTSWKSEESISTCEHKK